MRGSIGVSAAALAAVLSMGAFAQAQAAVIFNDNFDQEAMPADNWIQNDAALTNFNVIDGTGDVLTGGNTFGLVGSGTNASGYFVDLDGSTMDGGFLQTKQSFSYA